MFRWIVEFIHFNNAGKHKLSYIFAGSIQRTNGEAGDNRASYPVDWAAAQMRQAQVTYLFI